MVIGQDLSIQVWRGLDKKQMDNRGITHPTMLDQMYKAKSHNKVSMTVTYSVVVDVNWYSNPVH